MVVAGGQQRAVVASHTDQAKAHDQHAGHGAALEGDVHRGAQTSLGRLGGAYVGTHSDVHADKAGSCRQNSADQEADSDLPATQVGHEQEDQEEDGSDNCHRSVLAAQVRGGTFLNGRCNLAHLVVARGLREDPASQDHSI